MARAGLRDSALATAETARADSTVDETRNLVMLEAIVHTILGRHSQALDDLEVYFRANPQLRGQDDTWWWKDLRTDPRWQKIVGAD